MFALKSKAGTKLFMTPAARLNAVLEIYDRMLKIRVPMDATIGEYMRQRKYIGSKDRAAIADTAYAIMRHYGRLSWHIENAGMTITPRNLLIGYLALVAQETDIAKYFDGSKYAADALTTDETAFIEKIAGVPLEPDTMPESVRVECPPTLEKSLREYFGAAFADEMQAMLGTATLDLRVNVTMAPVEKVQAKLADDKVTAENLPYSPWGLRVKGKVFVSTTRAFVKGWIDIQDEGSQLIALACNAQPGMQVMDYCAGGGGKTLALANAMNKKGRIVAMDNDAKRLEKGRERFRRAHVTDIIEIRPLSDEKHAKWFRKQKQNFDVVLTDVPCSGTGTWRRNPDTRWRSFGPSLDELTIIQADIMDKASAAVKPGGRLVYATCSLLPEENEQQVEKFLARHPEFTLPPLAQAWPDDARVPCDGNYMRLTPHRHQTDGFFAAVLTRA